MPVTRIAIREGKTADYKQALMDEIYEAMRETVAIKDGDRFMAITEHGEHEFAYGPFLGIERGDDLVQIQVFWAPGKTVDAKLAMYRQIVERLGTNRNAIYKNLFDARRNLRARMVAAGHPVGYRHAA